MNLNYTNNSQTITTMNNKESQTFTLAVFIAFPPTQFHYYDKQNAKWISELSFHYVWETVQWFYLGIWNRMFKKARSKLWCKLHDCFICNLEGKFIWFLCLMFLCWQAIYVQHCIKYVSKAIMRTHEVL